MIITLSSSASQIVTRYLLHFIMHVLMPAFRLYYFLRVNVNNNLTAVDLDLYYLCNNYVLFSKTGGVLQTRGLGCFQFERQTKQCMR